LAILLIQSIAFTSGNASRIVKATPLSVSCGNATSIHCYGLQDWFGDVGAKTSITIVPLTCNNSGGGCGIITNEMWLLDIANTGCTFDDDQCWVEVGYWNAPGNGYSESYFWADNRPGSLVIIHFFGDIPAGDYNVPTAFSIARDCGSACYDVNVTGAKDSFHGLSTNNTMNPTGYYSRIQIGMELAGSNSDAASAPRAYFTYNQYENPAGVWS